MALKYSRGRVIVCESERKDAESEQGMHGFAVPGSAVGRCVACTSWKKYSCFPAEEGFWPLQVEKLHFHSPQIAKKGPNGENTCIKSNSLAEKPLSTRKEMDIFHLTNMHLTNMLTYMAPPRSKVRTPCTLSAQTLRTCAPAPPRRRLLRGKMRSNHASEVPNHRRDGYSCRLT